MYIVSIPQIDTRIRGKIIETVLCCSVSHKSTAEVNVDLPSVFVFLTGQLKMQKLGESTAGPAGLYYISFIICIARTAGSSLCRLLPTGVTHGMVCLWFHWPRLCHSKNSWAG